MNPNATGTKAAAHFRTVLPAGGQSVVRVRLCRREHQDPFRSFGRMVELRRHEADEFYSDL
ncbi:MAG: hypothetical protein ACJ746_16135 [Bryobacteraceae bacterium]